AHAGRGRICRRGRSQAVSLALNERKVGGEPPAAPAARAWNWPRILARLSPSKVVLCAFFASRLALFTVGLLTQVYIEPYSTHVNPLHLTDSAALRMWGVWDSEWYVGLASHGYSDHPRADGQVNWVFFPAYPLLSAGLAALTRMPVFAAMVLLSNAC